MKKVFIHYFTGTGNTAHAVKLIKQKLDKNKYDVQVIAIERDAVPPPATATVINFFAFPILSFGAPAIVKKYIKKLPITDKSKTGILSISGAMRFMGKIINGWPGQAIEQVERSLVRRGYNVFISRDISYPENWTQVSNPPGGDDVKKIFAQGDKKTEEYINDFMKEKQDLYRCNTIHKLWSKILNIFFDLIARRFFGKIYIADNSCNGCGICEKSCPAGVIKIFCKKPRWKSHCLACNRCINICPRKAIQTSPFRILYHLVMVTGLYILGIILVHNYSQIILYMLSSWVIVLIEIVVIILLFAIIHWVAFVFLDWVFILLEQIPLIRKLFSISWTKKFRRYRAGHFSVNTKFK